ncbi:MAG: hypothetical protein UY63_C0007G0016 [Parcubacteria group bacterium GW2011_GWA2_51_10]|nr:MAG: hypothetical protein UY63_C0007G0016 [Parcubacteria group bacterium GW2011_GWA2_51_10]
MSMGQTGKRKTGESPTEQLDDIGYYLPDYTEDIVSSADAYRLVQEPAARYHSPLTVREKLRLRIEGVLFRLFSTKDASFVATNGFFSVPMRWKKIFLYLYRAGITRSTIPFFEKIANDEPKMFAVRLETKRMPEDLTDGNTLPAAGDYGHGYATDPDVAISKMVGELLERYSLTIYKKKDFRVCDIADMRARGEKFLDPFTMDFFTKEQKQAAPRLQFGEKNTFRWTAADSLLDGRRTWIPAQFIYWNYRYAADEPMLTQPTTNGAAGMFTRDEAITAAIYEAVQRDAFLLHWLNRATPTKIDLSVIEDAALRQTLADCARYHLEVHAVNVTSDIPIPAIAIVVIDRTGKGPSVTVGAGAGNDPEHAIVRGLSEALSTRYWLRRRRATETYELPRGYIPFITPGLGQAQRILLWGKPGMEKDIEFFIAGKTMPLKLIFPRVRPSESPQHELAWLKEVFRAKGPGYDIYCVTPQHHISKALGYASAKVIIPAMIQLYLDEYMAPLNNPRLKDAYATVGLVPAKNVNPTPHPFP